MNFLLLILGVVLALVVLLQGAVYWQAKRARGTVVRGFPGSLGRIAESAGTVAAYLYSPNCSHCRVQGPTIERLQKEFPGITPVNILEEMEGARRLGILGTPATVVIHEGRVQRVFIGVASESDLRSALS
jgi:thiol-disulfide isomerase/thioredoxin